MACGSCGQGVKLAGAAAPYARGTGGRTLYRVVTAGGTGKVAFQTHDLDLARKVRGNYPGSVIDPDPDAAPAAVTTEVTDAPAPLGEEEPPPAEGSAAPKSRKRA